MTEKFKDTVKKREDQESQPDFSIKGVIPVELFVAILDTITDQYPEAKISNSEDGGYSVTLN